jgi:hypothetical protein
MNLKLILRASTLTLAIAASSFTAQAKSFVLPHVLEASSSVSSNPATPSNVCSPRDAASGLATGKSAADWDLKANKGARTAAPGAPSSCDQAPEATSTQKHNKTGHVTLMK